MALDDTEKLSIIPEVFYDLISRVPVGVLMLLTAYLFLPECHLPQVVRNPGSSTLAAIIVPIAGFILSYVLGLALSSLSRPLFWLFDKCRGNIIKKEFENLANLPQAKKHFDLTNADMKDLLKLRMRLHVFLKRSDSRVGLEMAKHQAEASLFANLTAGFTLLIAVFLYSNYVSASATPACPAITQNAYGTVVLLAIISAILAFLRNRNYWRYHFRYAETFLK